MARSLRLYRHQPFIVTLAYMINCELTEWLTQNANSDIGFGQDVAAEFASTFQQTAGDRNLRGRCYRPVVAA